jgi:hypothetical protein
MFDRSPGPQKPQQGLPYLHFRTDSMSPRALPLPWLEFSKMNERCANIYENKGPRRKTCRRSWNVLENKGSYPSFAGILLKTQAVKWMSFLCLATLAYFAPLPECFCPSKDNSQARRGGSCELPPFVARRGQGGCWSGAGAGQNGPPPQLGGASNATLPRLVPRLRVSCVLSPQNDKRRRLRNVTQLRRLSVTGWQRNC